MKIIKSILLLLSLLLMSHVAFADDYSDQLTSAGLFTMAPSDESMGMLMRLFGSIGSVLPGSPGLLGAMFEKFNYAILLIMVLTVMAYTLFRSIMETAHHGEFMGKKFDKLWTPLRVVGGLILIVPTIGGYSIIQVIVMWVVLQGVGAADNIWKTALLYFQNNQGQALTPPGAPETNIYAGSMSQNLLSGLICMYQAAKDDKVPYSTVSLMPDVTHNPASVNMNWVTFSYKTQAGIIYDCGNVQWVNPAWVAQQPAGSEREVWEAEQAKSLAIQNAAQQLLGTQNITAKNMAYLGAAESGYNPVAIGAGYLNSAVYAGVPHQDSKTLNDQFWQAAYSNGWALAGTYYFAIADSTHTAKTQSSFDNNDVRMNVCTISGGAPATQGTQYQYMTSACALTKPFFDTMWQRDTNGQSKASGQDGTLINDSKINIDADPLSLLVLDVGMMGVNDAFNRDIFRTMNDPNNPQDPVTAATSFGHDLCDTVETVFITFSYAVIGISAFMGICGSEVPSSLIMIIEMFVSMPMLLSLFGGLYLVGLTLGVYLPLIPYIVFFFAVIGWLLAVLESIIAAPLVALGVSYPEGHEVLGKADPALMLLVNVFLRPSLMIFGLLAGMLITYIGMDYVNTTFGSVINGIFSHELHPLEFLAILIVYGGILVALLNQTFSLIHILPDQVLRWIGGQHQFGHYGEGGKEAQNTAAGAPSQANKGTETKGAGMGKKEGQIGGGEALGKAARSAKNKLGGGDEGKSMETSVQIGGGEESPDSGASEESGAKGGTSGQSGSAGNGAAAGGDAPDSDDPDSLR